MTKTKKLFKTFALLLVLPLSLLLVACNPTSADVHKASTNWTKDANSHWHECACGDSSCNITYDLASHTWVDGETITTSTETTTLQTCACGATNTKITRTDAQIKVLLINLLNEYGSGNRTHTLKQDNTTVQTYDASTKEEIVVVGNTYIKIIKDGNNYKIYNGETQTYFTCLESEILPQLKQGGCLSTFVYFVDMLDTQPNMTTTTTNNEYKVSFMYSTNHVAITFNSDRLVNLTIDDTIANVTDTFDSETFNSWNPTGYPLDPND